MSVIQGQGVAMTAVGIHMHFSGDPVLDQCLVKPQAVLYRYRQVVRRMYQEGGWSMWAYLEFARVLLY
jgi:hypothetical protein